MTQWTMPGVKIVTGDPDIDDDHPDREPSIRELERVLAAGVALTPALARHHRNLTEAREEARALAADLPGFRATIARLRAEEVEARERAERARLVVFGSTPRAADDWLVIGLGLNVLTNSAGARYSTAREINGKRYEFDPDQRLHFVPALIGAAWLPRLPGLTFQSVPSDLLRALELHGDFARVAAGGKQNTGGGYSDVTVNWPALLAYATGIVNGCALPDVLRMWLASSGAASSDASQVFVKVIEARLSEIGAEAAA